jgi:hypothetical protein
MFLANALNKSPTWTVEHEPRPARLVSLANGEIRKRFDPPRYGEVNSYLRKVALFMGVPVQVLLRDPQEVVTSAWNTAKNHEVFLAPGGRFEQTVDAFRDTSRLIEKGCRVISFSEMTTDPEYLTGVAKSLGISDVTFAEEDLTPVNAMTKRMVASFSELPQAVRRVYLARVPMWYGRHF